MSADGKAYVSQPGPGGFAPSAPGTGSGGGLIARATNASGRHPGAAAATIAALAVMLLVMWFRARKGKTKAAGGTKKAGKAAATNDAAPDEIDSLIEDINKAK